MVPRGRLGSQTLCPYRVLPWNPRPGGRPGYSINVFSPILLRHSIFGLVYFTSIFPFIIIFCHLIFTQLLLIIVQTLCTSSVLLNVCKVNLPYIIWILLLRHGLQTWRPTRGNFGSVSTTLHDLSIAGIVIFSAFWIFSHDTWILMPYRRYWVYYQGMYYIFYRCESMTGWTHLRRHYHTFVG